MYEKIISNLKSLVYVEMHESHGNWSTEDYLNIILDIILLIFLSKKFEIFYYELIDEGLGYEEDKYKYEDFDIFYIPLESRWNTIIKNIENEDCRIVFDEALRYLKHEHHILKEIFLPFSINEIERRGLKTFLYLFNNQAIENENIEIEMWIEIYKSFLNDFVIFNKNYNHLFKKIDIITP